MKKSLICLFCVLAAIAFYIPAQAKVKGKCVNCHTMHNSQNRDPMAFQRSASKFEDTKTKTPNPSLLVSNCIGCHTETGTDTIIGKSETNNGTPIVFNVSEPDKPLAAGNFHYVGNDDAMGHNVDGIKSQDGTLATTPPGGSAMQSQLSCGGLSGCHGDRTEKNELDSVHKAHHTVIDESTKIDGTTTGRSYRFLKGVVGLEDKDWEQDDINTSHNEYKGTSGSSSISYLCKQCHGNFHDDSGVGSASPWLRHPTDIVLPNTGEYQYYNGVYGEDKGDYNMTVPLARPDIPDESSPTVTPGTDIVMCLSCHRAHGSPNFKMVRWDNLNSFADGCGVCHTSKQ